MGSALAGAGSGAVSGLGLGPWGALAGALAGGVGGYFGGGGSGDSGGGGLFGGGDQEKRFERFTPEQQQITELLRNILSGQGDQPQGGLLGSMFGEEGFKSFADPAMRMFQEEIVPGIAEKFSGLGAQRSSGFQQALAKSGENLATRLGEVRGQQQQGLLGALLSQIMQPQFHTRYEQGGPSMFAQGLGDLGSLIPQGISAYKDYKGQGAQQGSLIGPRGQITGTF